MNDNVISMPPCPVCGEQTIAPTGTEGWSCPNGCSLAQAPCPETLTFNCGHVVKRIELDCPRCKGHKDVDALRCAALRWTGDPAFAKWLNDEAATLEKWY